MTIRLPFLRTRCASPARRFRSNSLALIEVAPVPDLIHDDRPAFDTKTEAVVAGPQPIPAGEVAGEGLGPADGGPTLQPPQQLTEPLAKHAREPGQLPPRLRRQLDCGH